MPSSLASRETIPTKKTMANSGAVIGISLGLLCGGLAVGAAVAFAARRRGRVSAADRARIARAWSRVEALRDPARRVMEAEKAFDMLLVAWGRKGTFVEKFKPVQWRFPNAEALWQAHKLRNRLAHESGAEPGKGEGERAVRAFEAGLEKHLGPLA